MSFTNSKMFLKKLAIVCALAPATTWGLTDPNISTAKAENQSRFSLESSFEYSQRVAEAEEAAREESMDISLAPAYKINDLLRVSLRTILSKENQGSGEAQLSDTTLTLSIKGVELSPSVKTLHSVSAIAPTSVQSRDQNRLQGGLGLSNGLHYTTGKWDLTYRLGYTHFIHEYNMNAQGSPNVQHSLVHSLSAQVKLSKNVSLSALGIYRWGMTYGRKERSSFEIHSDLNFDVTKTMTVNIGTSNAGQALKANGVTSNISAFDEDKAILRGGISISL